MASKPKKMKILKNVRVLTNLLRWKSTQRKDILIELQVQYYSWVVLDIDCDCALHYFYILHPGLSKSFDLTFCHISGHNFKLHALFRELPHALSIIV